MTNPISGINNIGAAAPIVQDEEIKQQSATQEAEKVNQTEMTQDNNVKLEAIEDEPTKQRFLSAVSTFFNDLGSAVLNGFSGLLGKKD